MTTASPAVLALIATFESLTGQQYRVKGYAMCCQADEFLRAGYTADDLRAVVNWTISQRARGGQHGLRWVNVFGREGEGFMQFAERLAEAQKTIRTRPLPRPVPVTTDVGDGKITRLSFAPDPEPEAVGRLVADQLAALRKDMSA